MKPTDARPLTQLPRKPRCSSAPLRGTHLLVDRDRVGVALVAARALDLELELVVLVLGLEIGDVVHRCLEEQGELLSEGGWQRRARGVSPP